MLLSLFSNDNDAAGQSMGGSTHTRRITNWVYLPLGLVYSAW